MHGYISLELADHFVEFDDPVRSVMMPAGVVFTVGLGGDPRTRPGVARGGAATSRRQLELELSAYV